MSEEEKPTEEKPTIKELQEKIADIEKVLVKYRSELEETVKSRPLASAGVILVAGIVLGVLIGTAVSRR
ncbi:MAG: hypothetical protein GTN80_04365 [Nitrososphaeria archaeon]|nr:hypothetical protein [Nitrososphaeria archaeon]NIN52374.1 hypothetical protein [Nitrososphaeria archaeon]NIQ32862.1 hypothetical protein [Nitrososphaeria archaeon]